MVGNPLRIRHAGVHWPENAGGEHPSPATIIRLPGMAGASLTCSPSARYWYEAIRAANPAGVHVWRAIPRAGKLPANLNWKARPLADEVLNLWDEQIHHDTEHFLPLNELQFPKESGQAFQGYAYVASRLEDLRVELVDRFAKLGQTVRLHFPAWVPQDELDHLDEWQRYAERWDVIHLHCYGSAEAQLARYESYRAAFPNHPIFVGEWNANHEGAEEQLALEMWADVADRDPLLLGVTYYIWETRNDGEQDLSIFGNDERLKLFLSPPMAVAVTPPAPPLPPPPEVPVPEINPQEFWSFDQIAQAAQCPVENVRLTMTHLAPQLALCGLWRKDIVIGVIGTIAHETASSFLPVKEGFYLGEDPDGNPDGLSPAERHRRTLDYYPHFGMGDVQLTHETNYARYTVRLEQLWGAGSPNLVAHPELALDQDVAAAVIAMWFRDERALPTPSWPQGYSLQDACRLADDDWIRILVYGASDPVGQARIARVRQMLTGVPTSTSLSYNPDTAPQRQIQNWVCAIRAGTWALLSMGVNVTAAQMQDEMVPGTVTPAQGLLDGRGYGLASSIGAHLPRGTRIEVIPGCTWNDVWSRAGRGPICLGSGDSRLYHWINVALQRDDGALDAPNPAPNHPSPLPIGDVLDRSEFERYAGSWSMVFVEVYPVASDQPEPRPIGTPDLETLVGVAYHEDGVVIPALSGAIASGDWGQVEATRKFLRDNNPQRAA